MASHGQCQQALDAHADALMKLPGVTGVGIGDADAGCLVVVYVAPGADATGIPQTLSSAGGTVGVRVEPLEKPHLDG